MPYSLVLHCVSANSALRPEDRQGQKALALFLEELIQTQDATVAARLHAPKNAKPFTTAIMPRPGAGSDRYRGASTAAPRPTQSPGDASEVNIRLTLLDDALYPLVSQFFLQHLSHLPQLRLGQTALVVSRVLATPESGEPWVGFARFEDLLAASTAETSWTVHFATPTAFKAGDAELPLPIPRLCFQSWLNSWDEHAPIPFFPDKAARRAFLTEVVEGNVSVTYSQLRLVKPTFYFDGVQTRDQGFVGICRFSIRASKVASPYRRLLDALTRYSFYAGTGRKTTMGMGMTRRQEKEPAACQTSPP
jgi:CRISPR-associated endoribonuclease Cas6